MCDAERKNLELKESLSDNKTIQLASATLSLQNGHCGLFFKLLY
jgi:hypothetical protein